MPFHEGNLKRKRCPVCRVPRSIHSFNRSGKGMRRSQCRECEKAARIKDRDPDGRSSSTRHNIRRRYKVLQHYSGKEVPDCECCGCDIYEFLSLDHVEGNGGKHRSEIGSGRIYAWVWKNKLPPGFRVLCHNCNQAIGMYGYCPHHHPELAVKAPPPLLTIKKQEQADAALIAAAVKLNDNGIPVTASNLAKATKARLWSVEKRMARLRTEKKWPFQRIKPNLGRF